MIVKCFNYAVCIFLIFFMQCSFAQETNLVISSQMQYEYATKLFQHNDFQTAVVEFKRFIHFFPDDELVNQAEFKIAVCLFHLKKYDDAARAFNEIISHDKNKYLTKEAVFYQSKAFMNLGNSGYAQIVLQNYLKLVDDTLTRDRIYFNLVQIQLSDARNAKIDSLDAAKEYLSRISESSADKYNIEQYSRLIFNASQLGKKDPKIAGLMAIVPGGGFLYCERYKDAMMTFLLNAGLMAAAYNAYKNDNEALAGVLGIIETGFYTGNIYGSISSAHKYNQAQLIRILNKEFSITPRYDSKEQSYEILLNYKF